LIFLALLQINRWNFSCFCIWEGYWIEMRNNTFPTSLFQFKFFIFLIDMTYQFFQTWKMENRCLYP
jgi:hypothetical protein